MPGLLGISRLHLQIVPTDTSNCCKPAETMLLPVLKDAEYGLPGCTHCSAWLHQHLVLMGRPQIVLCHMKPAYAVYVCIHLTSCLCLAFWGLSFVIGEEEA